MTTAAREPDRRDSFFDERAFAYDREYNQQTAGGYALRIRREKVLRLFDQPGGKVLDVGCGPGIMAQAMINRDCAFWGVDPSQNMLEICRRRFGREKRMQFLRGDATQLAFPDAFFDAVLCMGVIDAVRDRRQAVREMLRVLKPGGTLLITFTNIVSPYSWWKKYVFYPAVAGYHSLRRGSGLGRLQWTLPPDPKERALYNKAEARDFLQSEGAEVVQILGYYFNIFLSPLDEIFKSPALWVTRKLEEGHWPRPEWIASGWIIKAKKKEGSPRESQAVLDTMDYRELKYGGN
jgi:ubiquinone/menaquinone biosynthesis C-methylase UbiE